MIRIEKAERLAQFCKAQYDCGQCKLNDYNCNFCVGTDQELDEMLSIIGDTVKDNVNHPNHYNRHGSIECIDEMVLVFGVEAVKKFCLCNVWEYRYRAADKNGAEDLNKSDWYLQKYKELCS